MLNNKLLQKALYCIVSAAIVLLLTSCSIEKEPKTEQAFLLNTIVSVTYYSPRDLPAVEAAIRLCSDYELVFSRTDSRSELFQLNQARSMDVSEDLLAVLTEALVVCSESRGRFDITMGNVSALYDFEGSFPHCPAPDTLSEAVSQVDFRSVNVSGKHVTLENPESCIDLGAIAKGYIADRMKDSLVRDGVKHAIISLGGNVLCIGGKPDGSDFAVGIKYPEKSSSKTVSVVLTSDSSIVTSGVYERFFEENGITYHHLLDSASGYPIRNGLLAVSITGPSSLRCDALSTACFAMGLEDGLAYINSLKGYEAVFITQDHELHRSLGFSQLERK